MQTSNKILKATMKPITTLILPIDKFGDWLFSQKQIKNSAEMKEGNFKGKNIDSMIEFNFKGGLLSPIDKAVLLALISERAAGNEIVSLQRLYKTLGGSHFLTADVKDWLLNSVRRLMNTSVKVNMTALVTKIYRGKRGTIEGNLLPAVIISAEINSKVTDSAIHLIADSPLLLIADIKSQIARLPIDSLAKIKGNENLLVLNWYLLERVIKIVGSNSSNRKKRVKKLNTSILLETLCQKCGFTALNKWQRQDLRENIKKILEHFKQIGLILEYRFVKKDREFYSIEISVNQVSTEKLTEENIN